VRSSVEANATIRPSLDNAGETIRVVAYLHKRRKIAPNCVKRTTTAITK
jgi:hypothetical protein